MKLLEEILTGLSWTRHSRLSLEGVRVQSIELDSRKIEEGSVFVALRGTKEAGIRFSGEALSKGAIAIVFHNEELPMLAHLQQQYPDRHFIAVSNTAETLGRMVSSFYAHPSSKLSLIGVTGTNGKTTVATLLQQLLEGLGEPCGLISSLYYYTGSESVPATHTTPNAIEIQRLMATMLRNGKRYASMEVSSHAIHQHRISGLSFDGAVFTNITHEHLDYHKDFQSYIQVKKRFFDDLPKNAFTLVNLDDSHARYMLQNCKAEQQKTYALQHMADYKAKVYSDSIEGLEMEIDGKRVSFMLSGAFNAYNLLAVLSVAELLGIDRVAALEVLSRLRGVKGRFEWIPNDKGLHIVVDYAHTPDALYKVLDSLSKIVKQHPSAKLFSVLGCGGDKDPFKRPKMGKIASQYSHLSVFTSDNPRSEDPALIIEEMKRALTAEEKSRVQGRLERSEAIEEALKQAHPGDFVLIAGKGHEEYEEIAGKRYPYSDHRVIQKCLQAS